MARSSYLRQKPLTVTQQRYFLTTTFSHFRAETTWNELRCVGEIRPSPLSDTYTIQITYKVPGHPKVHVISPQLRLAPGYDRLPHVFSGNELCLYLAGEWRADMRISDFIIPWISLWLRFYEFWLATGSWEGGGTHPDFPQHQQR